MGLYGRFTRKNGFYQPSGAIIFAAFLFSFPAAADLIDDEKPAETQTPTTPAAKASAGPTGAAQQKGAREKPATSPKVKPAEKSAQTKKGAAIPVQFTSKGLRGQKDSGIVELLEEVVVTQADFRLESENAKVFYDEGAKEAKKIIAQGNVQITKDDAASGQKIRANGNEVVFLNKERLIILRGNARLWRGNDLVRGREIIYELDTGYLKANKVDGVVEPKGKQ